jgi:hypothetical protein
MMICLAPAQRGNLQVASLRALNEDCRIRARYSSREANHANQLNGSGRIKPLLYTTSTDPSGKKRASTT